MILSPLLSRRPRISPTRPRLTPSGFTRTSVRSSVPSAIGAAKRPVSKRSSDRRTEPGRLDRPRVAGVAPRTSGAARPARTRFASVRATRAGHDREERRASGRVPRDPELASVGVTKEPERRGAAGRLLGEERVRQDLDLVRGRRSARRGGPALELDRDPRPVARFPDLVGTTGEPPTFRAQRRPRPAGSVDRSERADPPLAGAEGELPDGDRERHDARQQDGRPDPVRDRHVVQSPASRAATHAKTSPALPRTIHQSARPCRSRRLTARKWRSWTTIPSALAATLARVGPRDGGCRRYQNARGQYAYSETSRTVSQSEISSGSSRTRSLASSERILLFLPAETERSRPRPARRMSRLATGTGPAERRGRAGDRPLYFALRRRVGVFSAGASSAFCAGASAAAGAVASVDAGFVRRGRAAGFFGVFSE